METRFIFIIFAARRIRDCSYFRQNQEFPGRDESKLIYLGNQIHYMSLPELIAIINTNYYYKFYSEPSLLRFYYDYANVKD
ncbi:hypothetical protein RIVM261_046430 [Rivularia sp. IAM M-261]|nr:hypothetical protein RIVM261_046430 [Rivularia sp. IAM M-261]